MRHLISKNIRAKGLFFFFGAFYNLGMDIVLSRLLAPTMFGQFAITNGLVRGFEQIKAFNFEVNATKMHGDDESIFGNYLSLICILEVIFLIVSVISFYFIQSSSSPLFYLALKTVSSTFATFVAFYRCRVSKNLLMYKILRWLTFYKYATGLIIVGIAYFAPGTYVLFIGEIIFLSIQWFLYQRIFSFKLQFNLDKNIWRSFLKSGVFLWIVEFAPYLSIGMAYIFAGKWFGAGEVGVMSKAVLFVSMPTIYILYNFNSIMFNAVIKIIQEGSDFYSFIRIYIDVMVIGVVALTMILVLNKDWVIEFLWGPQWTKVVSVLDFLIPLVFALPVHAFFVDLMLAMKTPWHSIVITRYVQPCTMWVGFFVFGDGSFEQFILWFSLGYFMATVSQIYFLWQKDRRISRTLSAVLIISISVCWLASFGIFTSSYTGLILSGMVCVSYLVFLKIKGFGFDDLMVIIKAKDVE